MGDPSFLFDYMKLGRISCKFPENKVHIEITLNMPIKELKKSQKINFPCLCSCMQRTDRKPHIRRVSWIIFNPKLCDFFKTC